MNTSRCGLPARWTGILLAAAILALGGCSGDDGDDGTAGAPGADGSDGINCWDTNANGVADPAEDVNGDGTVDVFDCQTPPPSIGDAATLHAAYFADRTYEDGACLTCHGKIGDEILTTGHWKWEGVAAGIEGFEAGHPRQERHHQQPLRGRADQRGPLHAVPYRLRLHEPGLRFRQSQADRLLRLP